MDGRPTQAGINCPLSAAPRGILLRGALALVLVNIVGVLPLLVQRTVNELQPGFPLPQLLQQALIVAGLATLMGGVRLWSRLLVFGAGRRWKSRCGNASSITCCGRSRAQVQRTGGGEVISRSTSDVENVRRLLGFALLSLTNTVLVYSFTLPRC